MADASAKLIKSMSVLKLYRDSLRLATHLGSKSGTVETLRGEVRKAFRANMKETDPEKIYTMKEAAFRGLGNYIFVQAQKMAEEEGLSSVSDVDNNNNNTGSS